MTRSPARGRRADAVRSETAILDAAVRLLNVNPDTGLETIAAEAGVTRQTVYAHFPSRDRLLAAVVERITEDVVAAIDATGLEDGSATEALFRLLEASTAAANRYPVLRKALASVAVPTADDERQHAPITERITKVIARGQAAGEFDATLPPHWFATVTIELSHAAAHEVDNGRMPEARMSEALRVTLLRALGAALSQRSVGLHGDAAPPGSPAACR
ncbi:TetR/AcrR family transcriptional regulator [Stackebrandtia nassauensis]|uniref:Transcriptional regulator, TetR family n=1 Tax=Stackebrandtia nassauensis (strain DSM 44728 / CIP 108903 / NRRL B-16338 / NBRC 102104 / LLR-40K-21) TaxID=446470 RepID=D3PUU3_STANL|nr:TetR/AcrR family transcriptional regulator [Stackebrandtia nassauensis]ADD44967.1 transcriptional regulator, TetR family [Stackebrandtia nassauensis DSM 44728]